MSDDRPIVGISVGDPAGIGPEITAKALNVEEIYSICRPLVVCDLRVMVEAIRFSGLSLQTHAADEPGHGIYRHGTIDVFDMKNVDLAQLEAMIRAQKGFRHSPAGDADTRRVRHAYRTLGVEESASNDEIKKAYRRQMNKSHPDKIASSNPAPTVLAEAEKRTREVRSAYEMLKARRSIR